MVSSQTLAIAGMFRLRLGSAPVVYLRWPVRGVVVVFFLRLSGGSQGALKGLPDIIVIKRGQFIGLEVKTKVGRLSIDHVEFAQRVKEHGAFYHVVRSIDDVQRLGL